MSAADLVIPLLLGLGSLVCLVLGALVLRGALRHFRLMLRVSGDAAEPTDVGDVSPGTTAVSGTVRPADEGTIPAPFGDGEAVVAVGDTLKRGSSGEAGTGGPTTDQREIETVPFVVEDGTGSIRVEPGDGPFHGDRERFDPDEVDRSALAAWSERTGITPDDPIGYRQQVVAPGDEVYVFGDVVEADGVAPQTAGSDEATLRFVADGGGDGTEAASAAEDLVVSTEGRGDVGGAGLVGGVVLLFFAGLLLFFALVLFVTSLAWLL